MERITGDTLMDHQDTGAIFLASRSRAGLFDEMGLGKTITAIAALSIAMHTRGVVICPAILRANWVSEIKKWCPYTLKVCKGESVSDFDSWSSGAYDVLITSYEQATTWWRRVRGDKSIKFEFLIIDEGHYLKNWDSKRSKAILGYLANGEHGWVSRSDHAWWLTGTPMPNDPQDIYTFLRFCNAMPLAPVAFTSRFFTSTKTRFGSRNEIRLSDVNELRQLVSNNSLRRTKREVGLNIPPIHLTELLVEGDTEPVKKLVRQYPDIEDAILNAIEEGGLSLIDAQHIATLRRLVGEAKSVPYAELLVEELKQTKEKRVVFGVHIAALAIVGRALEVAGIPYVRIDGSTSEKARQHAIARFQRDPDLRCFVANMTVAGSGTTLTAACELDVLESEWSPGRNAQALMRVHRIGQARTVHARFISLADTIDATITHVVAQKVKAIAEIDSEPMVAAPTK